MKTMDSIWSADERHVREFCEELGRCHEQHPGLRVRLVRNSETFDPARHKQDAHNPSRAPFRVLERIAKNLCTPGRTPNGIHVARANGIRQDVFDERGRHMRSVWTLASAQYRGAHFAVWPPQLVERIIRAGCRYKHTGLVLDRDGEEELMRHLEADSEACSEAQANDTFAF